MTELEVTGESLNIQLQSMDDLQDTILKYDIKTHVWIEFGTLLSHGLGLGFSHAFWINNQFWLFGGFLHEADWDVSEQIRIFDPYLNETYLNYNLSLSLYQNSGYHNIAKVAGVVFFDKFCNCSRILLGGGSSMQSQLAIADIEDVQNDNFYISLNEAQWLQLQTPSPTQLENDILSRSSAHDWIECDDLEMIGDLSGAQIQGITEMVLGHFKHNSNTDSDVGMLCIIGGLYLSTSQRSIYCYNISNFTCDDDLGTVDTGAWQLMTVQLPIDIRVTDSNYVVINNTIVYIFGPVTQLSNGIADGSAIIRVAFTFNNNYNHNYETEADLLNATLKSVTDPYGTTITKCVCYNPKLNYVYALGYAGDDGTFLEIFDIETNEFLTKSEMDNLYIKYNLPANNIGAPRFDGTCAYDDYFNSILYFGGRSYDKTGKAFQLYTSVLVYSLYYNIWHCWNGVLDSPRLRANVLFENDLYYFLGGLSWDSLEITDDTAIESIDIEKAAPETSTILVYDPITNISYPSDVEFETVRSSFGSTIFHDYNNNSAIIIHGGVVQDLTSDEYLYSLKTLSSDYFDLAIKHKKELVEICTINSPLNTIIKLIAGNTIVFYVVAGFAGLMMLFLLFGMIHANTKILDNCYWFKKRKTDSANWYPCVRYLLQLVDIWSDINIIVYLWMIFVFYHSDGDWGNDCVPDVNLSNYKGSYWFNLLLAIASSIFVIFPYFMNAFLLIRLFFGKNDSNAILTRLAPFNQHALHATKSQDALRVTFALLCFVSGNFVASLKVVNCGLFGFSVLNMGLTRCELKRFYAYQVFNVLSENMPQLLICLFIMVVTNTYFDVVLLFSVAATMVALILTFFEFIALIKNETVECNFGLTITITPDPMWTSHKLNRKGLKTRSLGKRLANKLGIESTHVQIGNITAKRDSEIAIDGSVYFVVNKKPLLDNDDDKKTDHETEEKDQDSIVSVSHDTHDSHHQSKDQLIVSDKLNKKNKRFIKHWKYKFPTGFVDDSDKMSLDYLKQERILPTINTFIKMIQGTNDIQEIISEFYGKQAMIKKFTKIELKFIDGKTGDSVCVETWCKPKKSSKSKSFVNVYQFKPSNVSNKRHQRHHSNTSEYKPRITITRIPSRSPKSPQLK